MVGKEIWQSVYPQEKGQQENKCDKPIIRFHFDLKIGELVISTGDTHIYTNHIEQVNEQLSRESYPNSTLSLNKEIKDIDKFTMSDIVLNDYKSHGTIKAEMAV